MTIVLPPETPAVPPSDTGLVTSAGTRLYDRLAPVATYDPENGNIVRAIAEVLAEPQELVDQVARDTDTHLAWQAALDPDVTPDEFLPWLAQFAGTQLLPSDTAEQQRERIKSAAGFHRGTPRAIREEVQLTLTGTKFVNLLQRVGGDMWAITVVTRTTETPDPAATERAARAQKPAGMLMTFVVTDEPIIDEGTRTIDAATVTIDAPPTLADVT